MAFFSVVFSWLFGSRQVSSKEKVKTYKTKSQKPKISSPILVPRFPVGSLLSRL
ncbi:hypothetical protein ACHQM5_003439 [Ranunculus cassubicifolius]